jgi:hypothetical protein
MAGPAGFDGDRLMQRAFFLLRRAKAHLGAAARSARSIGFAATLLQDAGAILLIRGAAGEAAAALARAGSLLIDLGLPYGHVLLCLARGEGDEANLGGMFDYAAGAGVVRDLKHSPESGLRGAALDQPAQLLALLQARLLQPEREVSLAVGVVRERLEAHGGLRIGTSGIALRDYLRLCDWITGRSGEKQGEPSDILALLAAGRAEMLREAIADRYHWDRLIAPAQLVDFPLTVLFVLATRHEVRLGSLLTEQSGMDDAFELPLRASRLLVQERRFAAAERFT